MPGKGEGNGPPPIVSSPQGGHHSSKAGSASPPRLASSGEDRRDDLAVDVGQAHVAAAEAGGEPLVVEAQEVEDRGVEVVDLDLVFDGVIAVVVGGAMDGAPLDPAAGEPDGEAVRVVVAT